VYTLLVLVFGLYEPSACRGLLDSGRRRGPEWVSGPVLVSGSRARGPPTRVRRLRQGRASWSHNLLNLLVDEQVTVPRSTASRS